MTDRRTNLVSLLRAFSMLVVGALFSPSDVSASCGDYVLMTGAANHPHSLAVGPNSIEDHFLSSPRIAAGTNRPTAPCPCRGSSCSNRPLDPPPAPHRFTFSSTDQWGLMPDWLVLKFSVHSTTSTIPTSVHPALSVSHIFRPPRLAAVALQIRHS